MDDISPTSHEVTPTRVVPSTGTAPVVRIGLLGIAAAALVAVAILVIGLTARPTGTLAAGSSSGSTSGSSTGSSGAVDELNGFGLGFGGPGGRGGPGHAFGGITITAISGNDISLETVDGWTRTITVDSGTTYSKSGDSIALSDLQVGDQVAFRQTREDDGSFTIDAIAVIPPHAGGKVTAVSDSTITVEQRDGTSATITVTSDTTYVVDGDDATLADVEAGMFLVAEGTENADGSLTAARVRAADPDSSPRPGRGFRFHGPGPDGWGDTKPDATTAPSATEGAS